MPQFYPLNFRCSLAFRQHGDAFRAYNLEAPLASCFSLAFVTAAVRAARALRKSIHAPILPAKL